MQKKSENSEILLKSIVKCRKKWYNKEKKG